MGDIVKTSPGRDVTLAPKLNAFDATLIVIGGTIGSGIFMSPSIVAQRAHSTPLILGVWIFGGIVAMIGAFIFAELAWRRPHSGGLYGYMRDAYHPVVAFMYGWTALLVSQSGGMAAAAITFAAYVSPPNASPIVLSSIAIAAISILSLINCLGVREGGNAQNVLTLLKSAAIVALIVAGFVARPLLSHGALPHPVVSIPPAQLLVMFGAALIPVLYAYDGFQTTAFVDNELKDPKRTLPLGLLWGIVAVVVLYVAVTFVALRVLGAGGLAATSTPASDIMRLAFGPVGAWVIAGGIALSTLGFLSNNILTSPRIYYAMARDGLFFERVASLHPRTRVPVVAILLQGLVASVIALSGRYGQILNYVTSMDFIFLALAGGALIIFRRRSRGERRIAGVRVPGNTWGTAFFILVSAAVVVNTFILYPGDSLIGLAILFLGAPVYFAWRKRSGTSRSPATRVAP